MPCSPIVRPFSNSLAGLEPTVGGLVHDEAAPYFGLVGVVAGGDRRGGDHVAAAFALQGKRRESQSAASECRQGREGLKDGVE